MIEIVTICSAAAKAAISVTPCVVGGFFKSCGVLVPVVSVLRAFVPERRRRRFFTRATQLVRTEYSRDPLDVFRQEFEFSETTGFRSTVNNHQHPRSADARCAATSSMEKYITLLNMRRTQSEKVGKAPTHSEPYTRHDVATSSREKKFGCNGDRLVYDMSDLTQTFRYDDMKASSVVTMIDVDFHLDSWSGYAGCPVLAYTRIPQGIAGATAEGKYMIETDLAGKPILIEIVDGGAVWLSRYFNYSRDRVIIKGWWGLTFTICAVEKIPQPGMAGRFIVGIFPIARINMPMWLYWYSSWICNTHYAENYGELGLAENVKCVGNYVIARFLHRDKSGGDFIHVRHMGQVDEKSVMLPFDVWRSLHSETRADKAMNTPAHIEHRIKRCWNDAVSSREVLTWTRYFSEVREITLLRPLLVDATSTGKVVEPKQGLLHEAVANDINYQRADGRDDFDDGKPYATLVCPPIVSNVCAAPVESMGHEVFSVEKRVVGPRNSVEPGEAYKRYKTEFVDFLTPHETITQKTVQEIIESQKKPAQRARNAQFMRDGTGKKIKVKAMQKKEPYVEVKPARNISTVPVEMTVLLGRVFASIKASLERFEWFMPCKNPTQTAQAINRYCSSRKTVVETDYSKFDASLSRFLREVEQECVLMHFPESEREEIQKLLLKDMNLRAATRLGVRYDTLASRLSGSQSTTCGNTIINAFVAYCAFREQGLEPNEAFAQIGPKFGDDGIDDDCGLFLKVAIDLGIVIKIIKRSTLDHVDFCGRHYICPHSSTHSIFNVKKALMSMPMVASGKPRAHEAKINGYLAVDPLTPLLSEYGYAVKRAMGYGDYGSDGTGGYTYSSHNVSEGPFPYDASQGRKTLHVLSELLGITPGEICRLRDLLNKVATRADLETVPKIFVEREFCPAYRFISGKGAGTVKKDNMLGGRPDFSRREVPENKQNESGKRNEPKPERQQQQPQRQERQPQRGRRARGDQRGPRRAAPPRGGPRGNIFGGAHGGTHQPYGGAAERAAGGRANAGAARVRFLRKPNRAARANH